MDTHYGIDENGYYLYPDRPPGIPEDEEDYPKEYTLKEYSEEEVNDHRHYHSIRGSSIDRMQKGDVNVLNEDGVLETMRGWITGTSGLHFRSMALGLVKEDGWSVVELTTGRCLMPIQEIREEPEELQLSFDFVLKPAKLVKMTGKNRDEAIRIARANVMSFTKEQWIEINEQITYTLDGIEFKYIMTPEQERIEAEYAEKCAEVRKANDHKRAVDNFYSSFKPLRVYQHHNLKLKMTRKKGIVRVADKVDPKKKAKFFYNNEEYSNAIELEGIIFPIDVEGLTEMQEFIIVKGDQFKKTPLEENYSKGKYYVFDPHFGLHISKSASSLKDAKEQTLEYLTRATPEGVEKLNEKIRTHQEKIRAAQSDQDITQFLNNNGA